MASSFRRLLISGRSTHVVACGCRLGRLYSSSDHLQRPHDRTAVEKQPASTRSKDRSSFWNVRYEAEGKRVDAAEGAKRLPDIKFYVSSETIVRLSNTVDFSWRGLKRFVQRFDQDFELHTQRHIEDRHRILGPDLATAHFVVYRGGGVRFTGQNRWHRRDDRDEYVLPNKYVPNVTVEAIDLEGVRILFEGMVNLENLVNLRWLSLRGCEAVDDWFCDRLAHYKNTLEYLDISGCSNVTDNGVATFHRFKHLRTLKLENLENFKNRALVCLLIEEVLPHCKIIGGVDDESLVNSTTADASLGLDPMKS